MCEADPIFYVHVSNNTVPIFVGALTAIDRDQAVRYAKAMVGALPCLWTILRVVDVEANHSAAFTSLDGGPQWLPCEPPNPRLW